MSVSTARYLLRLDDLCPTMERSQWERVKALVTEYRISPILAVVPGNKDSNLALAAHDPAFWAEMRALEEAGATIALHGYQHLCMSEGPALLQLKERSEFAGVDEGRQLQWIREGIRILQTHGLDPKIWVAPNHGFDRGTLRALRASGISVVSDGLTRFPFKRDGVLWIPQQLWRPIEKQSGIWTICIHCNTVRLSEIDELAQFFRRHIAQLTSVESVIREFGTRELGWVEALYARCAFWRLRLSRVRRRLWPPCSAGA